MKAASKSTFLLLTVLTSIAVFATRSQFATGQPPQRQSQKQMYTELVKVIEKFADEHDVTDSELYTAITKQNTESELLGIGGVGILRTNLYVSTFRGTNELDGGGGWTRIAGTNGFATIVICSAGKIISTTAVSKYQASDLVFILYGPDNIKWFDWTNSTGGIYRRRD